MMRGGFGREFHLQLVLKSFLPITLYIEPPQVAYEKEFLFRHILKKIHVSASVGKQNSLAVAKHLFSISKLLLWESGSLTQNSVHSLTYPPPTHTHTRIYFNAFW